MATVTSKQIFDILDYTFTILPSDAGYNLFLSLMVISAFMHFLPYLVTMFAVCWEATKEAEHWRLAKTVSILFPVFAFNGSLLIGCAYVLPATMMFNFPDCNMDRCREPEAAASVFVVWVFTWIGCCLFVDLPFFWGLAYSVSQAISACPTDTFDEAYAVNMKVFALGVLPHCGCYILYGAFACLTGSFATLKGFELAAAVARRKNLLTFAKKLHVAGIRSSIVGLSMVLVPLALYGFVAVIKKFGSSKTVKACRKADGTEATTDETRESPV